MSYITSIGLSNPAHKIPQQAIAAFMVNAMGLNYEDGRKLQAVFRASGIQYRYSVLEDYGKEKSFSFYDKLESSQQLPSTQERLNVYQREAKQLSATAAKQCLQKGNMHPSEITHLIVVSCTGMYAPGLDIDLIKMLELQTIVERTCINFMGCYAAFNALKVADAICKSSAHAKVLVVCTELCSLHFQPTPTEDNILANALFADGSAALLIQPEAQPGLNFSIENFHNDLALQGEEAMAWHIGDYGFEMKLTSYVPEAIKSGIGKLTESLLNNLRHTHHSIKHYAIHPGGRKIIEVIQQALQLSEESVAPAFRVLQSYGNMSSPTVVFVLNEIATQLNQTNDGERVLSFAFGPGLTLESMLLKIAYA